MKKPIIVIVGGFRMPDGNASAVRCRGNAMLFSALQYKVVIVGKIDDSYRIKGQKWHSFFNMDCLDLEQCEKNFSKGIGYVSALTEKYDVESIKAIVAYNYPGEALNSLYKWCRHNDIHLISDTTEWYAFEGKNVIYALIRKLNTEYRMRYLNRKIGNIICSTNYIQKYYGNRYNTVVVPMVSSSNGSDCVDLRPHTPRRFIYAGSPGMNFSKDDIESIVKAFLSLKNKAYSLRLYGFTKEAFLKSYPFYKKILENHTDIHFMGRVSKQEVEAALSDSDFYVLYRYDTKVNKVGFSTKAMEAISSALPLISNDVNGDFQLYFKDRQALICGVNDYLGFLTNINKALQMSDKDIFEMKESCVKNNPFKIEKYLDSMSSFLKGLK